MAFLLEAMCPVTGQTRDRLVHTPPGGLARLWAGLEISPFESCTAKWCRMPSDLLTPSPSQREVLIPQRGGDEGSEVSLSAD